MKLLLASFKHETNTFSPVRTDLKRFFKNSPEVVVGEAAYLSRKGTGTGIGGLISACEDHGVDFYVAVSGHSRASGYVENEAFEEISTIILDAMRNDDYDGILLDLHGAMVTRQFEDAEGELLKRMREINPDIPIGVVLDMHANIYPEFVSKVNVLTGFHTYPHLDMEDAGKRAGDLLIRNIRKEISPVLYFSNRPMLPHIMKQGTHANPNKGLQEKCINLEKTTLLSASLFTGFPHADIKNAGLSAVFCTDGNIDLAKEECEKLLDEAWNERSNFVQPPCSIDTAFTRAASLKETPIVILDHCDNASSGGTMDTTEVLKAALDRGFKNAVFFAIQDPAAVEQAKSVGLGNTGDFQLGGKASLASTKDANPPLNLNARVINLHNGKVIFHGPMSAGVEISMGETAVLECAGIKIVIISTQAEPSDLSCFTTLDIDVHSADYIIIKSRIHWRAGLGPIARHVIECDSVGVTTSDYSKLDFGRVRRPIYPLDNI